MGPLTDRAGSAYTDKLYIAREYYILIIGALAPYVLHSTLMRSTLASFDLIGCKTPHSPSTIGVLFFFFFFLSRLTVFLLSTHEKSEFIERILICQIFAQTIQGVKLA